MNVAAGKIVQTAVFVGGDVDPIVVYEGQSRRGRGGHLPIVFQPGPGDASIGRAGPDAFDLRERPVSYHDGVSGSVGDLSDADAAIAEEDAIASHRVDLA